MCPACLAAISMIVAGVVSTGGAATLAMRARGRNKENEEASKGEELAGRAKVANSSEKEKQS